VGPLEGESVLDPDALVVVESPGRGETVVEEVGSTGSSSPHAAKLPVRRAAAARTAAPRVNCTIFAFVDDGSAPSAAPKNCDKR
jgi:hypothetical protein